MRNEYAIIMPFFRMYHALMWDVAALRCRELSRSMSDFKPGGSVPTRGIFVP